MAIGRNDVNNVYLKYSFECGCNDEIPIEVVINEDDSDLVISLKNEVKNLRQRVAQCEQPIPNIEIPEFLKEQAT